MKKFFPLAIASLSIMILLPTNLHSQSAQFRGPDRNGIYPDTALLKSWPENGPELLLMVTGLGEGYSSPVVSNGIIYITGKKDSLDYLSAVNKKGQILWQTPYGRSWTKTHSNSRSTPTIDGKRVYVVSGTGRLACIDASSGKEIWGKDVDKEFEADYHLFGLAESPLIVDNMVISLPGGKKTTMVAFNKETGELVWQSRSLEGRRSYTSPVLYEHENIRLILGFTSKDLIGVDPMDGNIVWTYPYYLKSVEKGVEKIGINMTNMPLINGNQIFITSGYNIPAVLLEIAEDGKSVTEVWENPTLDCHHHGVVLIDGYLYGSNYYDNRFGKWVCQDWKTGEVKYVTDWENKGAIISADNMLYVYEEKSGLVGLVKPDPEKFDVVSSFPIKEGKGPHWAHPSIYEGKLLVRHGEFLFVYNISK